MIFYIVTVGILIMIVGFVLYALWRKQRNQNRTEEDVFDFIIKNPDQAALYLIKNDEVFAQYSAHQMMPLASMVKLIILIEYVKQVGKGYIDKSQSVPITDLELYDIPGTDGGAYESWLDEFGMQQQNVRLHDVVKGMIHYNSYANFEYLLDRLGIEQVNQRLSMLDLSNHEDIYYLTSAFLIAPYLHTEEFLSKSQLKQKMKQMPMEDYRAYAGIIHGLLTQRKANHLIDQAINTNIIDFDVQKIVSQRLPSATVKEYAWLMNKISHEDGFEEETQVLLKGLLEKESVVPYRRWSHVGGKDEMVFVHNHIFYATIHGNNKFVLAVFLKDLKKAKQMWMDEKMADFIFRTLIDQSFQEQVVSRLS